jgi:hypothetical protein
MQPSTDVGSWVSLIGWSVVGTGKCYEVPIAGSASGESMPMMKALVGDTLVDDDRDIEIIESRDRSNLTIRYPGQSAVPEDPGPGPAPGGVDPAVPAPGEAVPARGQDQHQGGFDPR